MPEITKAVQPPPAPPIIVPPAKPVPPPPSPVPASGRPGKKFLKFLLAAAGVLVLLGLGYFGYGKFFSADRDSDSDSLPGINVDDVTRSDKDTDNDGLADSREQTLGTNPSDPDSDGDGLADGDEVNIYRSDPMLSDTDSDGFDDGAEAAKNYSPVVKSSDKATALELSLWQENITKFGLHEPTPSTLKLKAQAATDQKLTVYTNAAFRYSFEVPAVLAYRESADRTQVGVFIAGSSDLDPNFNTDPIFVSTAVIAENKTLKEWAADMYSADGFKSSDVKIGNTAAITIEGKTDDAVCGQRHTLFSKKSSVVIFTMTCTDLTPIEPYYQSILQSFKFTK